MKPDSELDFKWQKNHMREKSSTTHAEIEFLNSRIENPKKTSSNQN